MSNINYDVCIKINKSDYIFPERDCMKLVASWGLIDTAFIYVLYENFASNAFFPNSILYHQNAGMNINCPFVNLTSIHCTESASVLYSG